MNRNEKNNKLSPKATRREFIKKATKSTTAVIIAPNLIAGCKSVGNSSAKVVEKDLFDEALQMMSHIAPLGNHGPMAAEALVELGYTKQLPSFVKQFLNEFSASFPTKKKQIVKKEWEKVLGKGEYIVDWIEFFEKEIVKNNWKDLVSKWTDRFAPGLTASATHGLIRTGHAVRSLSKKETELRKKELAQALGYWAAHYEELPRSKEKKNLKLNPTDAINKIPVIPSDKVIQRGNIVQRLRNLHNFKEFAEVTNYIEIKGDTEKLISKLTEAFSVAYLERVNQRNFIRLIHIITSLASIRTLLPILSKKTTEKILFYGWQGGAGLISISGNQINENLDLNQKLNQKDLIKKAVESNEVHAIKFTEACLREYKLNPKSSYLLAAKDAVDRLT